MVIHNAVRPWATGLKDGGRGKTLVRRPTVDEGFAQG